MVVVEVLVAVVALGISCADSFAAMSSKGNQPLWPGAKFTEADRAKATQRALAYIERSAADPVNFAENGSDYVSCFYAISDTASDPDLRGRARRMGRHAARRWARTRSSVSPGASADDVADLVFGWLAASALGERDARVKEELRRAAARFAAVDLLLFDPAKEPPPGDIPYDCAFDSTPNPRGATVCSKCGRPLEMRNKYSVWLDALITAYSGDLYGVRLGGSYRDVIQWLPAMRPYFSRGEVPRPIFYDTIYALTHVVYTLNDYGRYLLPRELLPREFRFLRRNVLEAVAMNDPETIGELLDSLKSFGLTQSDEEIRMGMSYLLETQRADGTWGAPAQKDSYALYHAAWTGIDGLKECRWRGQGLSFPELRPLLEKLR